MKKLFLNLCALFALCIMPAQRISADTIELPLQQNPVSNENDFPELGHRSPARPIQCTIDTDTKEVVLTPCIDDIVSYEIWDEGQNVILFSTDDSAEFVDQVMTYTTTVLIAISTPDHTYIGWL